MGESLAERLRALLGLAPGDHAVVVAALRQDDRVLRAAYARIAHTTIADMRERLAEPGDHDRLAWPSADDYSAMVMRSQRHVWRSDAHLLWQDDGGDRGWRFAGLDFGEVIVRRRDGRPHEVEFRFTLGDQADSIVVPLPRAREQ